MSRQHPWTGAPEAGTREWYVWRLRTYGTLYSEHELAMMTGQIRERVIWRLKVKPDTSETSLSVVQESDPYPEDDSEGFTLEEISQELGVTRERVRQIEGRALHKLKTALRRMRSSHTTRQDFHEEWIFP